MSEHTRKLIRGALVLLLLSGCGGGGSGDGGGGSITPPVVPGGSSVNLTTEGTVYLDAGVILRVQADSGVGSVTVKAESSGTPGVIDGSALVISEEFTIESADLQRGDLTSPLLVSLPVDVSLLPTEVDPMAFDVQVYNTDTAAWDWVDGWAFYDSTTKDVSFWTGHFSRYRVLHSEPSDHDRYERFRVNSRNFSLIYYEPKDDIFGYDYAYAPPRDAAWSTVGRGIDTSADIWNYVEDLDEALEDALIYYLGIRTSAGTPLFTTPAESMQAYITYLPKKDSGGDSKFGIMRIASSLENYGELSRTATHELAHVLSGQYYTVYGAAYNRWLFEATADLWTSRALGMSRAAQIDFFKRTMATYLKVSLDASDEGSYYAAADFLHWLEQKTARPLAADAVAADFAKDLSGLDSLLTSGTTNLSDYYTEYVLQASVGNHDFNVPLVEASHILTASAAGATEEVELHHLSAKGLGVRANLDVDTMLVVSADPTAPAGDLKTYSYVSAGIPVSDALDYLESGLAAGERIVVKHFGKSGTAGVSSTGFYQIVINPALADSSDRSYTFETYLLAPPRMQVSEGQVDFTYDLQYPAPLDPVAGFNVYLGGQKLNAATLSATAGNFAHASIHAGSAVLVTVVDTLGNEWPEEITAPASNWEMQIDMQASATDINRCPRSETSVMRVNTTWIPVDVAPDGKVVINHDWTGTYSSGQQLHMEGSGTYVNETLRVSGSWTMNQNVPMVLGVSEGHVRAEQGTFTLGGHFTLGTFIHDRSALSAQASASYTVYGYSWDGNAWYANEPVNYTCNDQNPEIDVTEFRQK
jgi:hypothetical protein